MINIPPPTVLQKPLFVPDRLLMGPGPSNSPSRVLTALSRPLLGHLDEDFLQIMEETKQGIKYAFQTTNSVTFAVTGTGHCAMETAICNILEQDDTFLSVINGWWGERALDIGSRIGANCYSMKLSLGEVVNLAKLDNLISELKPSLLFICHGESSCGLLQPLDGISDICKRHGCLFLVDAVASLGAVPLLMDKYGIDILYSGSQKVLSAPPGLSPISFSINAMKKINERKTKIPSFYMNVPLLANYWNCDDNLISYHHTGSMSLVYALREALALLANETLEKSWLKHNICAKKLHDGLEKIGLSLLVTNKKYRLPTVTAVKVPDHVNCQGVIQYLRKRYDIDIAGGLGPTKGLIWRIGLMGHNCTEENVMFLLQAIEEALRKSKIQSLL